MRKACGACRYCVEFYAVSLSKGAADSAVKQFIKLHKKAMKKAARGLILAALSVVPGAGLEPARLAAGDFESPESTNFTTRAGNL